jgi:phosphotransferase system HPr (HPr) family protein
MKTGNAVVKCEHGLHLRVAADMVKIVNAHQSTVHIVCANCKEADACSIMQLLTLGATVGTKVKIIAEGLDEDMVTAKLKDLFEQGGGI